MRPSFLGKTLKLKLKMSRMKEEHNFLLKDLATQLEKRTGEIDRLKKEKSESLTSLSSKASNLQEVIRNLQDMNDQRKLHLLITYPNS